MRRVSSSRWAATGSTRPREACTLQTESSTVTYCSRPPVRSISVRPSVGRISASAPVTPCEWLSLVDTWTLSDVTVTHWHEAGAASTAREERLASTRWRSTLSPKVVAAAVLPVTTMSTLDLWRYIGHLSSNEQAAQAQKIQFWNRALYPFVCLVMVGLALPFAYLHFRAGGISFKIFTGIMLGIGFYLLNNLFSHVGLLNTWPPILSAAMPSIVALASALVALRWVERR